jgi:hypothetical protein
MLSVDKPEIACALIVIQLLGLSSAWLARICEAAAYRQLVQSVFLGCLVLVAASTMVALGLGPCGWVASGATLSLMVLTVTCDFSRNSRAEAW